MGAGDIKSRAQRPSDVMSGLRLSLSRRRTIELGLAVGMAFSAPGVRAAEEPPEVFFSPEVSADALIRIYEKLSGDLSGRVGIRPRILPKYAARASTLRRWMCSTERSVPRIM